MIDLHTVATPNGHKVSIMLEEIGAEYRVIEVNMGAGEQLTPEFLALNPNNKAPVLVDNDPSLAEPITVFETGAILIYLAEKAGRFLPASGAARYRVLQWLMFQKAAVGPFQGQAHHFVRYAPVEQDYAQERFLNETKRQLSVLEREFGQRDFLADDYSIADMALWPWIRCLSLIDIHPAQSYPKLQAWFERVGVREGVQRGKDVINGGVYELPPNFKIPLPEEVWSVNFGDRQFNRD